MVEVEAEVDQQCEEEVVLDEAVAMVVAGMVLHEAVDFEEVSEADVGVVGMPLIETCLHHRKDENLQGRLIKGKIFWKISIGSERRDDGILKHGCQEGSSHVCVVVADYEELFQSIDSKNFRERAGIESLITLFALFCQDTHRDTR